eukprot:TRINITY_DN7402_c0_g1_i2.p1 TRINITY_DN7402_c0_g1~~TRINITY_DN7402_c0_g1_i2.p1  ORF type:complete len:654 (-),score=186.84 TRINITY_DN7402_c0_g1_i2:107-1891(-)
MYYFKGKPRHGKADFAGTINLKDADVSDVEEPGKSYSFSITAKEDDGKVRQYWLRADTDLTKKEWMGVLVRKSKGVVHLEKEDRKFVMTHDDVISGIKRMYQEKQQEIESRFLWDEFFGPILRKSDFEALPQVLLLGQYSVGKTSFIQYLLHRKFPNMRIGPEPTTDRFTAVMYSEEDRVIPGSALSVDPDKPFQAVNKFGTGFLTKFEASCLNSDILRNVTLVDTPGVLAGDKQRIGRDYDFPEVVRQFADTSHVVLLLFDAHKLDISDEFRDAILALADNKEKIRIVLNKADQVTTQQLVRIYGSLMWSLGKVINTPEVMRVYIGSFWDKPYKNKENEKLFRAEQQDLLDDLNALPDDSTIRKVNEMVKRARTLRAHILVLGYLKANMPMFGAEEKKAKLISRLPEIYEELARTHKIPVGDFPGVDEYQKKLEKQDFKKFKDSSPKIMAVIEEILTRDLPRYMKLTAKDTHPVDDDELNPFGDAPAWEWGVDENFVGTQEVAWASLSPNGAALSGPQLKNPLLASGAPPSYLKKIWSLADIERTGKLDKDEFILAMWLAEQAKDGVAPPDTLPESLIPPSKRKGKNLFTDNR